MKSILQDIRYGLRVLSKSPAFTAVAVLTLALGIGANSAIFSLVNGILLVPIPYAKPEQLVSVRGTYPKGALVALRQQVRTMDVAAYAEGHEFNLTGNGEPVRLADTMVSAELFSVLGARPEFGRTYYPGEDTAGQDNYVILSHALWEQRFGKDANIIGRSIELEGVSRQVVGVMPADFRFPSTKTQIWVPLHNDPRAHAYWADDFMPVIGRLRPGATIQQAHAEIRMFQSHVGELFPWPMPRDWNADISVVPLQNGMVADVRTRLLLLLGAVALVLLIACANVANLMLSRSATREREIGIRSALGAGRQRIIRQLLTESVVLASLGGVLGLAFGSAGLTLLKATLPADTPRLAEVHMDWRVLAFSAGLSFLTGIIFGLAPALQSSRTSLTESIKSGGRGTAISVSQRLRGALAIGEVAFAMLLVVAAGLLIRSFWALSHVNPGFQAERVVTARITPNQSFCNDPSRCLAFYRVLLDKVQSAPSVKSAALVNDLPLDGRVTKRVVDLEDYTSPVAGLSPLLWLQAVTAAYFKVMSIPFLAGRGFTPADESGNPPVAILTASTAQKYWPGQNPIGKHIRFVREDQWRTVVGIIADVRAYDLQRNVPDWMKGTVYVPYSPKATLEDLRIPAEMSLVLQTSVEDTQIDTMLRSLVTALNSEVPVSELRTMRTVVSDAVATPASTASLFVTFAALALVLGLIGIYGVLAFLVSRRTREIGIRIAMGAQRHDVLWLVLREGAKFAAVGIALGLTAAFVVTRWMASELYGVSSADPVTFGSVALVMALVTMLACYIPARRAMSVDPMVALRYE
jgi:putative ABC transport system permease protein